MNPPPASVLRACVRDEGGCGWVSEWIRVLPLTWRVCVSKERRAYICHVMLVVPGAGVQYIMLYYVGRVNPAAQMMDSKAKPHCPPFHTSPPSLFFGFLLPVFFQNSGSCFGLLREKLKLVIKAPLTSTSWASARFQTQPTNFSSHKTPQRVVIDFRVSQPVRVIGVGVRADY
jgi:hypothetical protein